jgi:hypothetical protein
MKNWIAEARHASPMQRVHLALWALADVVAVAYLVAS